MSQSTTLRMPDELYERLRKAAYDERRPRNEIIVEAISRALDERDREVGDGTVRSE